MKSIFSVDVEALMHRAQTNHVDKLIFGAGKGGVYGVEMLSNIFNEYNVKATFFVDFAECFIHGDKKILAAAELISEKGHDVQLHIHPEVLLGNNKNGIQKDFSRLSLDEARLAFDYAQTKYYMLYKKQAHIFRAGSCKINSHTITAAKEYGIEISSNYNSSKSSGYPIHKIDNGGPFFWSNGIFEVPVDVFIPTLCQHNDLNDNLKKYFLNNNINREYLNILFHSWSLLQRDPNGYHTQTNAFIIERFHEIIENVLEVSTMCGYDQIEKNVYTTIDTETVLYCDDRESIHQNVYAIEEGKPLTISNLELNEHPLMFGLKISSDCILSIDVDLLCGPNIQINRALLGFYFYGDNYFDQTTISDFNNSLYFKKYKYLRTEPGISQTKLNINIAQSARKIIIGIQSWHSNDAIRLQSLKILASNCNSNKSESLDLNKNSYHAKNSNVVVPLMHFPNGINEWSLDICNRFNTTLPKSLSASSAIKNILTVSTYNLDGYNYNWYVDKSKNIHFLANRSCISESELHEIELFFSKSASLGIEKILFESVILNSPIENSSMEVDTVKSIYGLELKVCPSELFSNISKNLLYDIRRDEKKIREQFGHVEYKISTIGSLTETDLNEYGDFIDAHIHRKLSKISQEDRLTYRWSAKNSFIYNLEDHLCNSIAFQLLNEDKLLAVNVCTIVGNTLQLIASGYRDDLTKYGLGKVLFFKMLLYCFEHPKISFLDLGGGNFGYKERFGAKAHNIATIKKSIAYSNNNTIYYNHDSIIEPYDLMLPKGEHRLQSTPYDCMAALLDDLSIDNNSVFFDIGCGTGKVISIAAKFGFNKIVGIEYSTVAAASASRILSQESEIYSNIIIYNASILDVPSEFLAEGDYFYMYNPFDETTCAFFATSLVKSYEIRNRRVILIYLNPICSNVFFRAGFKEINFYRKGFDGWFFDDALVLEYAI